MPKRPTETSNARTKRRRFRKRDHKLEYARRIARGLTKGLSRSQARGHARAGERPKPFAGQRVDPKSPLERGIRQMRPPSSMSLRAAAKEVGVPEESLRRYLKENTTARRVGRTWQIEDQRARQFPVYSERRLAHPWLSPDETRRAGEYMQAVKRFVESGGYQNLAPYYTRGVRDISGSFYMFEIDGDVLYELYSAGELSFPEMYRIIA